MGRSSRVSISREVRCGGRPVHAHPWRGWAGTRGLQDCSARSSPSPTGHLHEVIQSLPHTPAMAVATASTLMVHAGLGDLEKWVAGALPLLAGVWSVRMENVPHDGTEWDVNAETETITSSAAFVAGLLGFSVHPFQSRETRGGVRVRRTRSTATGWLGTMGVFVYTLCYAAIHLPRCIISERDESRFLPIASADARQQLAAEGHQQPFTAEGGAQQHPCRSYPHCADPGPAAGG